MRHADKDARQLEIDNNPDSENLVEIYYQEILRYCIWHTMNRTVAEDATQETFLKAVRYFDKYQHEGKFKAFLYKIAANTCVDMWRRKKTDVLLDTISYEEKKFEEVEGNTDFKLLLQKLPENLKEVIILRFVNELSLREIAELLEKPLRTIQSQLRKGLKMIEYEMQKGDEHSEKKDRRGIQTNDI